MTVELDANVQVAGNAPLAVRAVYERAHVIMARTDRIYHAVTTDTAAGTAVGYMPMGGWAGVWADGKYDLARSEFAPIGSGKPAGCGSGCRQPAW